MGLATPAKLLGWALLLAAGLGASLARPTLAPWLPALLPMPLLALVALERLWGAISRFLGRSLQTLLLFAALFLGVRYALGLALRGQILRSLPLVALGSRLPAALPTTRLVAGAQACLAGRGFPPSALLLAWVWILALLLAAFAILRGELAGTARPASPRKGPATLWSFRHPRTGVALHHAFTLRHSKLGRFTVFMPILALMTLFEPIVCGFRVASRGGSIWIIAWTGWVMLPLGGLACDVFGFDRGGVRTFWALPLGTPISWRARHWPRDPSRHASCC